MIATHSNAFLDIPGVNTYRCWLDEAHHTRCELASKASDKHAILVDLGYKPSDILQANFVIWVEGPSDRTYLKHWIHAKDPDLIEGLHYMIMFYGGRLLSHLSYDSLPADEDSLVTDFISLARLNRNAAIVIDSDRETAEGALNRTKERIREEFERESCLVWITDGRMIENYLPASLLTRLLRRFTRRPRKNSCGDSTGT